MPQRRSPLALARRRRDDGARGVLGRRPRPRRARRQRSDARAVADAAPTRHAVGRGARASASARSTSRRFPVARLKNEATYHGAASVDGALRDPPRRQDPRLAQLGGRSTSDPARPSRSPPTAPTPATARPASSPRSPSAPGRPTSARSSPPPRPRTPASRATRGTATASVKGNAHAVVAQCPRAVAVVGVRGLPEQRRGDPGRRHGAVRLAGGIEPLRRRPGRPQRCAVLLRARCLHRLVATRSLLLSELQAQVPVVVRSPTAQIARLSSRRESPERQQGSSR